MSDRYVLTVDCVYSWDWMHYSWSILLGWTNDKTIAERFFKDPPVEIYNIEHADQANYSKVSMNDTYLYEERSPPGSIDNTFGATKPKDSGWVKVEDMTNLFPNILPMMSDDLKQRYNNTKLDKGFEGILLKPGTIDPIDVPNLSIESDLLNFMEFLETGDYNCYDISEGFDEDQPVYYKDGQFAITYRIPEVEIVDWDRLTKMVTHLNLLHI